jgi:hypothetical protein
LRAVVTHEDAAIGAIIIERAGLAIGSFLIREFVRISPDIIRVGIVSKLNGLNGGSSRQHGPGYTVHAIHDAPVSRNNDGKAQIRLSYQADVIDNTLPRQGTFVLGAEWFVKFSDGSQWDMNARKVFGSLNEPINVPG